MFHPASPGKREEIVNFSSCVAALASIGRFLRTAFVDRDRRAVRKATGSHVRQLWDTAAPRRRELPGSVRVRRPMRRSKRWQRGWRGLLFRCERCAAQFGQTLQDLWLERRIAHTA